jgi:hypothetical protein
VRRDTKTGQDASSSEVKGENGGSFNWYKIWQLQVPNKVKMFIWSFAHNSLPVWRNVARRGVDIDTRCPMCLRLDEDCGHLFFKCKNVKLCWRLLNLENVRMELVNCQSGSETISKLWKFDKHIQLKVIVLLWRWWSARNKLNNGERLQNAEEVQNSISYFLMDLDKLQGKRNVPSNLVKQTWRPPPEDFYKINSDGAFHSKTKSGGWGFLVRNSLGDVLLATAGNIAHAASAIQTEAIAALKSIQQAAQFGMQ